MRAPFRHKETTKTRTLIAFFDGMHNKKTSHKICGMFAADFSALVTPTEKYGTPILIRKNCTLSTTVILVMLLTLTAKETYLYFSAA